MVAVLVKILAGIFGLAAGAIATIVIVALFVAGVGLLLLFTPFAAIAVVFGSKKAWEFSGGFRTLTEWCLEKVAEAWSSLARHVFD